MLITKFSATPDYSLSFFLTAFMVGSFFKTFGRYGLGMVFPILTVKLDIDIALPKLQ